MQQEQGPLTYAASGVNYDPVDRFKRGMQQVGECSAQTTHPASVDGDNFTHLPESRGESAAVIRALYDYQIAVVDEGLGTKNLIADACANKLGRNTTYWRGIAIDTVAMTVNDLLTVGALPFALTLHLQVASADWFADEQRVSEFAEGMLAACQLANAPLVCGETPVLSDIIVPGASSLSCSGLGKVCGVPLSGANIKVGDRIILVRSSGVHANGLTLCRRLAEKLPEGYQTFIHPADGQRSVNESLTYGAALLEPTVIYVKLMTKVLLADGLRTLTMGPAPAARLRYCINITGHGWRKLMRATQPFSYVINRLPKPHRIFSFIQEHAELDNRQMYETFNMGAGFALIVDPSFAGEVLAIAGTHGYDALDAGEVQPAEDGQRRVVIEPLGITYGADTLHIR